MKDKKILPHYCVVAGVIRRDAQVLIAQRPPHGLLGGLWEFPGGKINTGEELHEALIRELKEELDIHVYLFKALGIYRHAFTHFRITLHAFECKLEKNIDPYAREHQAFNWVQPKYLLNYPMGKVDRQISKDLLQGG